VAGPFSFYFFRLVRRVGSSNQWLKSLLNFQWGAIWPHPPDQMKESRVNARNLLNTTYCLESISSKQIF